MNAFDSALRFVASEHSRANDLCVELMRCIRDAAERGDIVTCLRHREDLLRLRGQIEGLVTAKTQLQMVEKCIEQPVPIEPSFPVSARQVTALAEWLYTGDDASHVQLTSKDNDTLLAVQGDDHIQLDNDGELA